MKTLILALVLVATTMVAYTKPHCQGFNNYDNKVTIAFTDNSAGKRYNVSDVKFSPYRKGVVYQATSVNTYLKDGVATVTLVFPHTTKFSNPTVDLRINGKKTRFKVCQ